MIRRATLQDLALTIQLEEHFFADATHKPEVANAYRMVIEQGTVDLSYTNDRLTGMLALLPIDRLYAHRDEVLDLPAHSPLRERFQRGYLEGYQDRQFVHAFVSERFSPDLTRLFRRQQKMIGFVPEDEERALRFYERTGCYRKGTVENIHAPGKRDVVFLYDDARSESSPVAQGE